MIRGAFCRYIVILLSIYNREQSRSALGDLTSYEVFYGRRWHGYNAEPSLNISVESVTEAENGSLIDSSGSTVETETCLDDPAKVRETIMKFA